jgi:phospholipid transport system transporter-binding protein
LAQIRQEGNRWLVSGAMTMAQVNALLAQSSALSVTNELEVDLAEVTDVDTTTISLLFEWLRQACGRKCKVTFVHLPENLVSLATLYGVLELLPQSPH